MKKEFITVTRGICEGAGEAPLPRKAHITIGFTPRRGADLRCENLQGKLCQPVDVFNRDATLCPVAMALNPKDTERARQKERVDVIVTAKTPVGEITYNSAKRIARFRDADISLPNIQGM